MELSNAKTKENSLKHRNNMGVVLDVNLRKILRDVAS